MSALKCPITAFLIRTNGCDWSCGHSGWEKNIYSRYNTYLDSHIIIFLITPNGCVSTLKRELAGAAVMIQDPSQPGPWNLSDIKSYKEGEGNRRLATSCKCKAHYTTQHENKYSGRVTWGKRRKRLIDKNRVLQRSPSESPASVLLGKDKQSLPLPKPISSPR